MSLKESFSADEWTSISRAPFLIATAIGVADASGPLGMIKEGTTLAREVATAMSGGAGALATEVAAELKTHRPSASDLNSGAKTKADALEAAAGKLHDVAALVDAKAAADAPAFKSWLAGLATHVAEAAKEGGFLGFGGEAVSADEKAALARINTALGL